MKKIIGLVLLAALIAGIVIFFRVSPSGDSILTEWAKSGDHLLPLITVASLLDSINPCAFSILLLTIAFLFSLGRTRTNVMLIGGLYVFGIFVVYILIGLGILGTLQFFGVPNFMGKVGAAILMIFGLIEIIDVFFPNFPIKLVIPQASKGIIARLMEKASAPTAFFLGVAVGLFEFPCTGGPYLTVLGLLHDAKNAISYLAGFGYLVYYNFVFVLPLLVILLIASDKLILGKFQEWRKANVRGMRIGVGVAMAVLGLGLFLL